LSQKLLRVNGEQRFYGFEFGNDLSVHDKIRSKGFIKSNIIVGYRHWLLAFCY